MDWNDDVIGRLRALWSEGHSTAEIGRRLGVSKNAVVGKAHRLALAARPSPIRRDSLTAQLRRDAPPTRVTGPTLPALSPASTKTVLALTPEKLPRPQDLLQAVAAPRSGGRVIACCWPIGEPGTRSFHFCGAESVSGKPYCAEHAQLAYVKIRDKREHAA